MEIETQNQAYNLRPAFKEWLKREFYEDVDDDRIVITSDTVEALSRRSMALPVGKMNDWPIVFTVIGNNAGLYILDTGKYRLCANMDNWGLYDDD